MSDLRTFAVLLPILLTACGTHVSDGRSAGEFDVPAGATTVRVTLEKGSLSVSPSTDGKIHWEAATRKAAQDPADLAKLEDLAMDLVLEGSEAGEVRLVGPRLPSELAERDPSAVLAMKVAVRVPPGLSLVLRTQRGSLGVQDREANVDLRTDAGEIRLERVNGSAKTFTGSGNHMIVDHVGSVELDSEHGDFLVYVRELGDAGVTIRAKAGTVQCNLPPGSSFELTASTGLGEIESPFDLPIEAVKGGARQVGNVGIGGPPVIVEARRGNLSVRCKSRG